MFKPGRLLKNIKNKYKNNIKCKDITNMFSIICVYNDKSILDNNLIVTLNKQNERFELILIDNRYGQYKTLTKALNIGGIQAKGDYLMFVHQDVMLKNKTWLKRAETFMNNLDNIGAAGVAGIDKEDNPVGFFNDRRISNQFNFSISYNYYNNLNNIHNNNFIIHF